MPVLSVYLPVSPERPSDFLPYAALVHRSSAARLWLGQSFTFDSRQCLAHDGHVQGGHYRDMLARAGATVDPARPVQAAEALMEAGLFLWGSPDEIASGVQDYFAAGVDEVALCFGGAAAVQPHVETVSDIAAVLAASESGTLGSATPPNPVHPSPNTNHEE